MSEEVLVPSRLLIVDDHEVVREGVAAALAKDERLDIVGTVSSAKEALEVARRTLPDLALVDLRLPDQRGEELTRELRTRFPGTAVIVLSTYLSEGTVQASLDAGASAYVTKAAGLGELRAAIDRVLSGDGPDAGSAPQIVNQLHALVAARIEEPILTPRQESVLELAAEGLTDRQIAERLHISGSTVGFHMQKLKDRLEARTRTELIAKAIRAGVIALATEDGEGPG